MRIRSACAVLCILLLCPFVAAQGYDQLLPESTIFYVSIEDVGRSKTRFKETALHALWNDPAMKAFMEKPMASWAKTVEEAEQQSGVNPEQAMALVNGQAVLAIMSPGAGDDVKMLALVDVGANADKIKEFIATGEKKRLEDGKVRRDEEEFSGVTIVHYTRDDEAELDGPSCWCVADGLLAFADDIEDLKKVLVRRGEDAAEGSLAAGAVYTKSRRKLGARSDLFAFFNVKQLWAALAEANVIDEETDKIMAALGLKAIDGIALQGTIEKTALDIQLHVAMNGPKKGILKLFDGKGSALVPPRFIPPDAAGAGVWALDLTVIWNEVIKVANEISPGSGMMIEGGLQMARGQIGADIKAMILALGDEIAYYTKLPDPDEPGAQMPVQGLGFMDVPRMVVAFSVRDKDTLDREMNNMVAALAGQVKELDYLGVKVRYFETGTPMSPALAVLPDRFVFALQVDDLKELINRYGKDVKGLADREDWARAMAAMPAERSQIGVSNDARALHSTFSSGVFAMLVQQAGGMFDPSLFPSIEILEKYLDLGSSAWVNEEDGIYLKSRMGLKPVVKEEGSDEPGDEGG